MINNFDYKGVYEKLNITFRKNNFKNEEQLKKFFENHLYSRNKIDSIDVNKNGDNYICSLEISDKSKTIKQVIKMNIIMRLKEGTDFEMSFSFE